MAPVTVQAWCVCSGLYQPVACALAPADDRVIFCKFRLECGLIGKQTYCVFGRKAPLYTAKARDVNLLFISNFYPPHHLGGYELLCHEATTRLIARGHTVEVLTSTYGITSPAPNEPGIQRKLRLQE